MQCVVCKQPKPNSIWIATCGHNYCRDCLANLAPTESTKFKCHGLSIALNGDQVYCMTKLKLEKFYHTTFEEIGAKAMSDAQEKVFKVYNHTREDFDNVLDYNLFLEERERLAYNLATKTDELATKEKIKEHKKRKKALQQAQVPITNEQKLSPSEFRLQAQKYIMEEYDRVRYRRQKREDLLTYWGTGGFDPHNLSAKGWALEKEDERLSLREPQVLLKYQKPQLTGPTFSAQYAPSSANHVMSLGMQLPELIDQNAPKTPMSMTREYNAKLETLPEPDRAKYEKQSKLAGGYKPTLYATRYIQEAFGSLSA